MSSVISMPKPALQQTKDGRQPEREREREMQTEKSNYMNEYGPKRSCEGDGKREMLSHDDIV